MILKFKAKTLKKNLLQSGSKLYVNEFLKFENKLKFQKFVPKTF